MSATSPFRITSVEFIVEINSRQLAELKKRGVGNIDDTIYTGGVARAEETVLDFFKKRTLLNVKDAKGTFSYQSGDRFSYQVTVPLI